MRVVLISIFFSLISILTVTAQELDFDVSVSAPTINFADPKAFEQLQKEIRAILNNNTWTDHTYQDHEKIKGQVTLTITNELSATSFEAELAIVTARPVYNSTYTSPIIKYLDKNVRFSYDGISPLQKSDNNYVDDLSSIITFYAYFIIGMDYDSFSPSGGEPYFDKAWDVYNALPSAKKRSDPGWTADDRSKLNRFYLIENVRNPSLRGYRSAFYEYHRQGLDMMHDDPNKARATITSTITQLGEVEKAYPRTIIIRMFSEAKELEIVELYKPGNKGEKEKVSKIMANINPLKATAYKQMR